MPLDNETPKVRNNPQPTPKDDAVIAAHEQADKDIEQDPDLTPTASPIDDLDEGESARFEDEAAKDDV
ncbi:hypothetical protein [Segetibacter aerophilus]|uniref:Uncharacterized protein n=1 Tax=Segetibacter aerophilus TaxID=670293 RepID=A0A512BFM5_9BACT|nr:hypothetical protein [Segetibacter aerophilus]GEO10762.1 hypothetical protein SAE01_32580 [Segetibacter aerophilus]